MRLLADIGVSLDLPASLLSGGQRQALSVVMAISAQAPVGLFDEPIAGLRPDVGKRIIELILEHRVPDGAIVLVEHTSFDLFGAQVRRLRLLPRE